MKLHDSRANPPHADPRRPTLKVGEELAHKAAFLRITHGGEE
jgi:hypothetical protein